MNVTCVTLTFVTMLLQDTTQEAKTRRVNLTIPEDVYQILKVLTALSRFNQVGTYLTQGVVIPHVKEKSIDLPKAVSDNKETAKMR